jgi:hypothetical protein
LKVEIVIEGAACTKQEGNSRGKKANRWRYVPSLDGGIQLPRDIRGPKNEYSSIIVADTVDLSSAYIK